ncbi:hypothetical protein [Sorangium sp. So ce128]|uniref:hypothetical protein n=1 Tax=Sorangium sp. So ce128 TaxID=3133281 RepID=UPI003F62B32C
MLSFSRGAAAFIAISITAGPLFAAGNSIRFARDQAEGTVVTVQGVVSVPSGAFAPNDEGFAIQKGNSGIYIHDALGGSYALGQKVIVTGAVANSYGQVLGLQPTAVAVTGSHPVHAAKPIDTGDVGEGSEGTLVRIQGTVVDDVFDDGAYGYRFHVDDGSGEVTVFVYTGTGIDVSGIALGDEVEITGFSGQFLDHYEVNPRVASDIEEVSGCD